MSVEKQLVVLLGPPGAGKGTLSMRAIKDLGWSQLSTGNLCRKHIAEQSAIGKQIDFAIKSGKLVSDSLIGQMAAQWINSHIDGATIILDGYPRTVAQAKHLNEMLADELKDWTLKVVRLELPDEEVVTRLCGRYVCENKDCQAVFSTVEGSPLAPRVPFVCDVCLGPLGRRNDDGDESIRERLKIYHQHEGDLLDFYYRNNQEVLKCDVDKTFEQVYVQFKRLLGVEGV